MKLFVWRNTECNKLYSHGDIVAFAPDLEQAKAVVLEAAKSATIGYANMKDLAEQTTWGDDMADDAEEEIAIVLNKVRADLEEPPEIHETATAIFFNGSE